MRNFDSTDLRVTTIVVLAQGFWILIIEPSGQRKLMSEQSGLVQVRASQFAWQGNQSGRTMWIRYSRRNSQHWASVSVARKTYRFLYQDKHRPNNTQVYLSRPPYPRPRRAAIVWEGKAVSCLVTSLMVRHQDTCRGSR